MKWRFNRCGTTSVICFGTAVWLIARTAADGIALCLKCIVSFGTDKDEIDKKISYLLSNFAREIEEENDAAKIECKSHGCSKPRRLIFNQITGHCISVRFFKLGRGLEIGSFRVRECSRSLPKWHRPHCPFRRSRTPNATKWPTRDTGHM